MLVGWVVSHILFGSFILSAQDSFWVSERRAGVR